jgi:hypothetical protein
VPTLRDFSISAGQALPYGFVKTAQFQVREHSYGRDDLILGPYGQQIDLARLPNPLDDHTSLDPILLRHAHGA